MHILRNVLLRLILTVLLFTQASQLLAKPPHHHPQLALTLYATDGATLYAVNPDTGATNTVGKFAVPIWHLAYDWHRHTLYGLGGGTLSDRTLFQIDRSNAALNLIGTITEFDGRVEGFSWNPKTSGLYLSLRPPRQEAPFNAYLYQVDENTAALTLVDGVFWAYDPFTPLGEMAFDVNGVLYVAVPYANPSQIASVDLQAGQLKTLWTLPYEGPYIYGIAFRPDTGVFYVTGYELGIGLPWGLFAVDVAGNVKQIASQPYYSSIVFATSPFVVRR